ncbi:uncharacterized protein LOC121732702 [Aricia agestis]|uniref:uncharacterized protein LOC121732702 n=1 Tax=Aricia agestis TaxID=91739 RepID=UPI001C206387|nr:uncharacterized protein LOC121732702 [Aricia agestis]
MEVPTGDSIDTGGPSDSGVENGGQDNPSFEKEPETSPEPAPETPEKQENEAEAEENGTPNGHAADEPETNGVDGSKMTINPGLTQPAVMSAPVDLNNGKAPEKDVEGDQPERAMWGNQIEFLMSCIATSVGLGNVWRFPFVAYQNGGGAFLIPYIIVLLLIGKPMYYLEGVIGQFSSRNSVKVWALSPAMKGTGYAQALGSGYILSYYVSIIALCLYYLVMSFQATLPWAVCLPEWENCVPADQVEGIDDSLNATSSAELYFVRTVLQQSDGIEGGLGLPIWYLTLCLFVAWLIIFFIVSRGVKSSGKAAYFLAIFPYVVMIILLISTLLLEGSGNGILFFLTPQWDKLIELDVWYAAVTQVFFSLSVCTGAIIMFSSYNGFRSNVYRDAMIVTTLDTFTSLLSGITIFGILGNLAHVLNREVDQVVGSGGTGLAFVSYPDAIAKTFQPQLFSVLFFVMMSVLGVGSAVALLSVINTLMMDAFPRIPTVFMSAFCCTIGFAIGLVYVTPGGQYILEIVDYYGGTFLVLFCGITEIIGVFWIYGLENLCLDIEFMLGIKTSMYWRLCWGIITPAMMIVVFIYALISFEALVFAETYVYPTAGYVSGYLMLFAGIILVPVCIFIGINKNKTGKFSESVKKAFRPKSTWGPRDAETKREWALFKEDAWEQADKMRKSAFQHICSILTGGYRRLENLCLDIEFMLGIKTSMYWRLCWGIITPAMMIIVFVYALISFEGLVFGGYYVYPTAGYVAGYLILFAGIILVPLFTIKRAFQTKSSWGPRDATAKRECEDNRNVTKQENYRINQPKFTKDDVIKAKQDDKKDAEKDQPERAMWGNQIEFLMSCIATSVGLGNVWRFPFVAYQNGGGAFLIPYIIVLVVIGKPMYYLEGVIGQFSSRNSAKVWALSPAMKGTGYAQAMGTMYILSYYVSIIALCLYYLVMSFRSRLPWAACRPEWEKCVPSSQTHGIELIQNGTSSAELYFVKTVLQQSDGIENGLGLPIWYLTLCLFAAWLIIFVIVSQGVKSSGKAAYFLAIFPYIVMIILLISTLLLDGSTNGILFFLTPQWDKLTQLDVWYAAVTQVFFSLGVSTGAIIMFSSYNSFRQNVYRDAMIVTTLDTFTSLLSGVTIFGILGNLAYVLNREVNQVVGSGGTGLAFVSYPDAIAKTFQPQLFSVLFFLMMSVLGVGSAVALLSVINTLMMDAFPRTPIVFVSAFCCTVGFGVGLIFVTPGGQYVLEIVDYYGGTFLLLFGGIAEIIGVFWIYGLENLCLDIEFMLGIKTSMYWRLCWGIITPAMMIIVFVYALISFEGLVFGGYYVYPTAGYVAGYLILFAGIILVPLFVCLAIRKNRTGNCFDTIKRAFQTKSSWGPRDATAKREWLLFKEDAMTQAKNMRTSFCNHIKLILTGRYRQ